MSHPESRSTVVVSSEWRRLWKALAIPLGIGVFVVVAAIIMTLLNSGKSFGRLDSGSYEPEGSRALAVLLADQGVDIAATRTIAETEENLGRGPATLLITQPNLLTPQHISRLREQANTVILVEPNTTIVNAVAPQLGTTAPVAVRPRSADCDLSEVRAAGVVAFGGGGYAFANGSGSDDGATLCYRTGSAGALARISDNQGDLTMVGAGDLLTNDFLAREGNAALAMRLLGQEERVVWHAPSPNDPALADGEKSLTDLLPRNWVFAAIQVGVAVVLFALWRSRRLGPVVVENLPSVVRSSETTEGRARLYRRGRSADHAAHVLRRATRRKLIVLLGLGKDAQQSAIVDGVVARTSRTAEQVMDIVYGSQPIAESDLARLARALDALIIDVAEGKKRD